MAYKIPLHIEIIFDDRLVFPDQQINSLRKSTLIMKAVAKRNILSVLYNN
jgi:hypothetical protein